MTGGSSKRPSESFAEQLSPRLETYSGIVRHTWAHHPALELVRRLVMPKRNPLIQMRLGQDKYSSWKTFFYHAYWSVELK